MITPYLLILIFFGTVNSWAFTSNDYAGPWTLSTGTYDNSISAPRFDNSSPAAPWDNSSLPSLPAGTVFRFRTHFIAPQTEPPSGFAFYAGPTDYPVDVLVNGMLVYRSGRYIHNPFMGLTHNSAVVQVPWAILEQGHSNILEVLAYSLYHRTPIPEFVATNADAASNEVFRRNMLNSWIILALSVTAVIFAVYYFFLFLMHRTDGLRYLYFSLTCATFAGAYCIFSFMPDNADQLIYYKVARPSLYFSVFFIMLFTFDYTRLMARGFGRIVRLAVAFLSGGIAVISSFIMVLQDNLSSFGSWYARTMPFGLMLPLVLILVLYIVSLLRRRNLSDLVLFTAYGIVIAGAVFDIIYIIRDRNPYLWLTPYGYAVFLVANMFVLAREQAATYDKALRRDQDIREKNRVLESSMKEKERVAGAVARNTERVLSAAAQIASEASTLYNAARIQSEATEKTVALLYSYQEKLRSGLSTLKEQDNSLNGITLSVEGLSAGIDRIAQAADAIRGRMKNNVSQSREGQDKLTVSAGESALLSESIHRVTQTVQAVGESTESIDGILRIIQGIADQTNILSMNAAIEAAHAGEAGKGFAIVAGEVRKLADDSTRSVTDIEGLISGIRKAIRDAVKTAEDMNANSERARTLADEARALLTAIVGEMDTTSTEVTSIADTTAGQREKGRSVTESARAVRQGASLVLQAMEAQAREAEEIGSAVNNVARLIMDSARAADELSRLAAELNSASADLSSVTTEAVSRN